MSFVVKRPFVPMVGDPDDHRPNSSFAIAADDGPEGARVESLCVLFERCAPGDRIPSHIHESDEAVLVTGGTVEYTLGDETRTVEAGDTVFIAAGVAHGMRNASEADAFITGVFPTTTLSIKYLENNPAPGVEGIANDQMQSLDARTLDW